jgi:hypothetical protein
MLDLSVEDGIIESSLDCFGTSDSRNAIRRLYPKVDPYIGQFGNSRGDTLTMGITTEQY